MFKFLIPIGVLIILDSVKNLAFGKEVDEEDICTIEKQIDENNNYILVEKIKEISYNNSNKKK